MRVRISLLLPAIACCLLFASPARATDYAYGHTSTYIDGNVVRGYHRTEVDYNSDVYYTPYVCASIYKDGVEVVRTCGGGFASATKNTQTAYVSGSNYSALSDHYVNIEYEEEDPYNPGYYYYSDVLGYNFSPGGSHPIDWYFSASGIYNQRPDESIRLGDTNAEPRRLPHHLVVVSDVVGNHCTVVKRTLVFQIVDITGQPTGPATVKEAFLNISQNTCGNGSATADGCMTTDGIFGDTIHVGCVSVSGTCGYNITKQYQWCRPGYSPVPLATYSGWTHNDSISVFNVVTPSTIPAGTAVYP